MKEKSRKEKDIEPTMYYETIGILIVVFCVVSIAELGSIGVGFRLFFKMLFGDWYYIYILMLAIYGVYIIVRQKFISYSSSLSVGLCLMTIGVSTISNLSVYEYLSNYDSNILISSWNYLYTSVHDNTNVLGGGIIGAIFSSVLVLTLGYSGAKIVGVILIIFSLSYIRNKTIILQLEEIKSLFVTSYNKIRGVNINLRYRPVMFVKNSKLNVNKLSYIKRDDNFELQYRMINNVNKEIHNILLHNDVKYEFKSMSIGYQYTRFIYDIFTVSIDVEKIYKQVLSFINDLSVLTFENSKLTLDIPNRFRINIDLRTILENQSNFNKSNIIPIGMINNKEIRDLDFNQNNLLILGEEGNGINTFIYNLMITYKTKYFDNEYVFYILDNDHDLKYLKYNKNYIEVDDFEKVFDELTIEIEKRLDLLSFKKVNDIQEYNKLLEGDGLKLRELKRITLVAFLEDVGSIINNMQDMIYVSQVGLQTGINIIFVSKKYNVETVNQLDFAKLIFKTTDLDFSKKVVGSDYAYKLLSKGDCILYCNNEYTRLQTPKLVLDDLFTD